MSFGHSHPCVLYYQDNIDKKRHLFLIRSTLLSIVHYTDEYPTSVDKILLNHILLEIFKYICTRTVTKSRRSVHGI